MKRYIYLFLIFVVVILIIGTYLTTPRTAQNPITSITPLVEPTPLPVLGVSSSKCHAIHVNSSDSESFLPDPDCTPGVIDPAVTQENIFQTICASGYTKTVRPSVTYTNKLKTSQITDYGYTDTNPKNYEEDHLISLELGGSPADPKNLWPEPGASPNAKDAVENTCHKKVCSGLILLSQAQRDIAVNWLTACR